MKAQGIKDLFLPPKIARHVKFMLFCAIFTPIWGLIINADLNADYLLNTFIIMFIMIEVVYTLSNKILRFKINPSQKAIAYKDIIRIYLFRLILFYLTVIALGALIVVLYIFLSYVLRGYDIPSSEWFLNIFLNTLKGTAFGFLLATPIFFFVPWQQSLKREFELREQNLIFQNETLKSQVNPHFLFNSLNTLTSLINNEVENATRFVTKLSLIYRYILDNSARTRIPLKEEIAFIQDYFYMHQIRNEGKINLVVDLNENEYGYDILPVSLQLLVENAIKHNMATSEKPLNIHIYQEDGYIVVQNNIQKMATQLVSTKIGLKNLNERLRLVSGKELIVSESDTHFIVKVPLLS